jgi:GTPase
MSGPGGDGVVAWHREPYKPKGGPDGGDGGDGGSVILRADSSVGTLLEVRDHPHIKAERGGHGSGNRKHGANGRDRIVLVPAGTVVFDDADGTLLADLANPGDELVAAPGGRGGRGNASFATATRRAPDFAQKGEPAIQATLRLELRVLADVGLVGFPNAGKSTLIARVSAARPKIADYPFTTLTPNLGVVTWEGGSFVVADIPGLVPGAHRGRGLGHQFLRHVRRAAVLVFLIDLAAPDRDPAEDLAILKGELEAYDPELAARPSLVVAAKADVGADRLDEVLKRVPDAQPVSAVTGKGVAGLVEHLGRLVEEARAAAPAPVGYVRHVVRDDPIRVSKENGGWRISGRRVERAVASTDFENEEAVVRLQRRMAQMGIEDRLGEAGASRGDEVRIGDATFEWEPDAG